MATTVRDETRKVTNENISTQVQPKVKIQDTTEEFQELSINTSIEDKQKKKAQNDLKLYKLLIDDLNDKRNGIAHKAKQKKFFSEIDKLIEIDEEIDKVNIKILTVQKGLISIDSDEDKNSLHERNDSTGTYCFFVSLTLKNRNITLRVGSLIIK